MKAAILVNYTFYTGRRSKIDSTAEAGFDTDRSSFTEQASILIDSLDIFVTSTRATRR